MYFALSSREKVILPSLSYPLKQKDHLPISISSFDSSKFIILLLIIVPHSICLMPTITSIYFTVNSHIEITMIGLTVAGYFSPAAIYYSFRQRKPSSIGFCLSTFHIQQYPPFLVLSIQICDYCFKLFLQYVFGDKESAFINAIFYVYLVGQEV